MTAEAPPRPIVGEFVEGIDFPVLNERGVRASAGLLFLVGIVGFMVAALTGEFRLLRLFGMVFVADMAIRLFIGSRFAPSLLLGSLIVRRQRPEWVGASQKTLAWSIGLGMALLSCLAMGWLGLPAAATLALCGLCLALLFLETAFGICVGCELQRRLSRTKPQLCAGDSCDYVPPKRGERHSVLRG